jgi:hypothetical protein
VLITDNTNQCSGASMVRAKTLCILEMTIHTELLKGYISGLEVAQEVEQAQSPEFKLQYR